MNKNYPIPVQDSMEDSEVTDSIIPDLTNSSFDSKYKNKQDWDEQSNLNCNEKWIMEEYPVEKINGTPQK